MNLKLYFMRATFLFTLFSFSSLVFAQQPLTSASLDQLWNSRETLQGQNQIIQFMHNYETVPNDFGVAWRVARLAYFIGNFGLGEDLSTAEHLKLYEYGYQAGEIAQKREPGKVEGHYWYAIDLGLYSQAKGTVSSLQNAAQGRDALLEAANIDPTYHWGGPYRILGKYYQELPSIISFGDKEKAADYFDKAIKIAPHFRLNTIYRAILAEKIGNTQQAIDLLQIALKKPLTDGKVEEEKYNKLLQKTLKKLND